MAEFQGLHVSRICPGGGGGGGGVDGVTDTAWLEKLYNFISGHLDSSNQHTSPSLFTLG